MQLIQGQQTTTLATVITQDLISFVFIMKLTIHIKYLIKVSKFSVPIPPPASVYNQQ